MKFPARYASLKRQLVPEGKESLIIDAWNQILAELATATEQFKQAGSDIVPQVEFSQLGELSQEEVERIKRRGSVLIRNVIDDQVALGYKQGLREYIATNPDVRGFPVNQKQFFEIYWSKPQLQARSHPNVIAVSEWLNGLYHRKDPESLPLAGVSPSTALTYADRFRIRNPGVRWTVHSPHIDGGSVERWEDPGLRSCFDDILKGKWQEHDPYVLDGRVNGNSDLYNRENQCSVFRTFQGWLAMSDTGPTEGTLKVFPDLLLSNAYLILRPFFRPLEPPISSDPLDPANWIFDISTPDIPGIEAQPDGKFSGLMISDRLHPHLRVDEVMVAIPRVKPGDMVFWHCDVIHAVETEHTGPSDSSVMYIPAVPQTPANDEYIDRQKETFLRGNVPPDFPAGPGEATFVGCGGISDIQESGRRAMGFEGFQGIIV